MLSVINCVKCTREDVCVNLGQHGIGCHCRAVFEGTRGQGRDEFWYVRQGEKVVIMCWHHLAQIAEGMPDDDARIIRDYGPNDPQWLAMGDRENALYTELAVAAWDSTDKIDA